MKLEVNKIYSGFVVKHAEYVDEIQSDAYLLEHEKSGARLLYLANSDDNKVFSISFRTPPYDDTGVAHILEHSSYRRSAYSGTFFTVRFAQVSFKRAFCGTG